MPLTPEQKKAQTHTIGPHAFDAVTSEESEHARQLKSAKPVKEKEQDFSSLSEEAKKQKFRDLWKGMTQRQRAEYLNRPDHTVAELEWLGSTLGFNKGHSDATMSATPKPNLMTLKGLIQEARNLAPKYINPASNQLPTVVGQVGGWAGGTAAGANAGPWTAGAARVGGSALGGATGEVLRQGIEHALGQDDPDYTWGQRISDVEKEALWQGGTEAIFNKLARSLRPTFDKSIDKIVAVGGLSGAGPLGAVGTRNVETVMKDLLEHEKLPGNKVVTIGDFSNLLNTAKRDIGNKVDLAMMQPVQRGGKKIPLGSAEADVTPIRDRITDMLKAHPSEAAGKIGEDPTKFANIRARANKYAKPSTFRDLTDHRIKLNNNLRALYDLPKGEQAKFLLEHPSLELDKIEADAIRDIIYPEMDRAVGKPLGTTAKLQAKRGALMSLSADFDNKVGIAAGVHAKSREIAGTPWWKRGNFSTYGTSSGKPGMAIHRIGSLVVRPNPEKEAGALVSRAFGNKVTTKAAKALTTPVGTEVLSAPLRYLMNPGNAFGPDTHTKDPDEEQDTEPTQDQDNEQESTQPQGISSLRQLREEAERRRPKEMASRAQYPVKITHSFNPQTGQIEEL